MAAPNYQSKKTIRQLRQARGWTQFDVALGLGVTQSAVAKWERGRVPTPGHQQGLANLFGVGAEAIAFGRAVQVPHDRP